MRPTEEVLREFAEQQTPEPIVVGFGWPLETPEGTTFVTRPTLMKPHCRDCGELLIDCRCVYPDA